MFVPLCWLNQYPCNCALAVLLTTNFPLLIQAGRQGCILMRSALTRKYLEAQSKTALHLSEPLSTLRGRPHNPKTAAWYDSVFLNSFASPPLASSDEIRNLPSLVFGKKACER